ncbi:MAG: MBL fold metallo-hydrolase [Victivallaceae bacterium]
MKLKIGKSSLNDFLAGITIDEEGIVLWWLGQAGFAVYSGGTRILIDPYLSDFLAHKYSDKEFKHIRLVPAPCQIGDVSALDAVLCTHAHSDHMDPGTIPVIAKNLPGCRMVLPRAEITKAKNIGIPEGQIRGLNTGEKIKVGNFEIEAIPAAHETLRINGAGEYHHLGYIVKSGKIKIYHSGDCVPFPGLAEILRSRNIDVALLPVNGRDEYRSSQGILGNFSYSEAVALCIKAGIQFMIAHHWGMFSFNTVPPEKLKKMILWTSEIKCILPEHGKSYTMSQ